MAPTWEPTTATRTATPTVAALAEGGDPGEKTVASACSDDLVTITPDEDLDRAVVLMREHSLRRLPVVEEGDAVGIVSIGDLAIERDERSAIGDISAAGPKQ